MLCSFMDSLYFYGLLALGGLCAHLYEHPPTNSTLSPIWAPTVRRNPLTLTLTLTLTMSPMFVSPKTTQTHICITNNLPTIYLT